MLSTLTILNLKTGNENNTSFESKSYFWIGLQGEIISTISENKPNINDRIIFNKENLIPRTSKIVKNNIFGKKLYKTSWVFLETISEDKLREYRKKIMNNEIKDFYLEKIQFIQSKFNKDTASDYEKNNNFVENNLYNFVKEDRNDNIWFFSYENKIPEMETRRMINDIEVRPLNYIKIDSNIFIKKFLINWIPVNTSSTKKEYLKENNITSYDLSDYKNEL